MDLFEILFIAAFVLLPLLEGLLRKKKGPPGPGSPPGRGSHQLPQTRTERPEPSMGETSPWEPAESRPEPATASDMVPDDLWELLTGERREPGPVAVETPAADEEYAPWEVSPEWSEAPEWDEASQAPAEDDLSIEYVGPEAVSLEGPPPPPEVRHAAFHAKVDAPARAARPKRRSALARTLSGREGLRRAIVLSEVLGRPRGWEDPA